MNPCEYCGGLDGWCPGPSHATHCPRYRKPVRRVKTIKGNMG